MQVTDGNIGSDPVLVLPRHVLKVQFTRIEYKYEVADELFKIIKDKNRSSGFDRALAILENRYGVDKEIIQYFYDSTGHKSKSSYKLDKTFIPTLIAVRDKNKVFKYDYSRSMFKNKSLTIEYDSSGVAGKVTSVNEDKTLDIILSGISAVGGIAGGFTKSELGDTEKDYEKGKADSNYINEKLLLNLNNALKKYNALMDNAVMIQDNTVFETIKKKLEEDVVKEFSKVFYKRTLTPVVCEMTIDIPDKISTDKSPAEKYKFFALNKSGIIEYNNKDFGPVLFKPIEVFVPTMKLPDSCYQLTFTKAPDFANPASVFKSSTIEKNPVKIVYNIPQAEVIRLFTSKNQTLFQETFKIAQHGSLGYVSGKKYSKIEATYIANTGELKIITTEQKALTTDQVDKAGTTAKSIFELFKKPTETEELEKKIKLDELRKKWDAIEKEKQ